MSHFSIGIIKRRKRLPMLSYIFLFILSVIAGDFVYAYTVDTNVYSPTDYTTFRPPAKGGSYTDAVFGTGIKRLTDSMSMTRTDTGGVLGSITPEYSTMSPFNQDNTRLLLLHFAYFALYDGAGNYLRDLPSEIVASSQPRWSRSDPNVIYYLRGNQLKQYNAGTNAMTVVRAFTQYSTLSGGGESDICFDGKHFVFVGDNRYVFVYDIAANSQGQVFDTGGRGFDSLYITPNDNVTITWYSAGSSRYQGIELFDKNMNFQRQLTKAGGHMDITRETNGDEVLIWTNSADPAAICQNGVVKVRLSDAKQTCLIALDWSLAVHISAADNSGWAFVETYAPSDPMPPANWKRFTDELIQVKLDGSEVRRLAHHRSRPFNSYTYMPKVSVSRDGTMLVYASNFGLQSTGLPKEYSDVYMIDLKSSSPGSGGSSSGSSGSGSSGSGSSGSGSSGSTSGGSSSGSSSGSTTTPGVTRIEQDGSGITYTGDWINNPNFVHSGGSAVMAASAGSRATFSFNGTAANWIGLKDEYSGIAKVYVDGVDKGEIDGYRTPASTNLNQYSISGLPSGNHTLTIEVLGRRNATSTANWVWVDAFETTGSSTGGSTTPPTTTTTPPTTTTTPPTTTTTPPTSTTTPTVNRTEETGGGIAYVGAWSNNVNSIHSGGSAKLAMDAGYRATFNFAGTGANWIGLNDEYSGIAKVYVDGIVKTEVDTYKTPMKTKQVLYSVTGLAAGTHTLTIEATGRKNAASRGSWIWVDAFEAISGTGGSATTTTPSPTPIPTPAPAPTPTPSPIGTSYHVEQTISQVKFAGTWLANNNSVHSGGSAKFAMDAGSQVSLTFVGSSITWIGYRDMWSGIARVIVDGVDRGDVDLYSAGNLARTNLFSATGLSFGTHTITIRATGRRNAASKGAWIWVDAFDYVGSALTSITIDPEITTAQTFNPGGHSKVSSGVQALKVGYAEIATSATAPSGTAVVGVWQNGTLISEAGISASTLTQQARIHAEVDGPVNTGLALANPNSGAANISFYFTNTSGAQTSSGTLTIPPRSQIAKFLDESPFSAARPTNGTFSFSSDLPVGVTALRGFTNERSEFLVTTLPVASINTHTPATLYFPHIASGGGWATQFVLMNPTDETIAGSLDFFGQGAAGAAAAQMAIAIDGQNRASIPYSIPPRASVQFFSKSFDQNVLVGSARVNPGEGSSAPSGIAIFSYTRNGIRVTETGVPLQRQGKAFRLYAESGPSIRTGVAIMNTSVSAEQVTFEISDMDGISPGLQGTMQIPAGGQRVLFLDEIPGLDSLKAKFKGVLRVVTETEADLVVTALRGRWNDRADFLITTTAVSDESDPPKTHTVFPHFADGEGYKTEFILFSGSPLEPATGSLQTYSQNGGPLNLSFF